MAKLARIFPRRAVRCNPNNGWSQDTRRMHSKPAKLSAKVPSTSSAPSSSGAIWDGPSVYASNDQGLVQHMDREHRLGQITAQRAVAVQMDACETERGDHRAPLLDAVENRTY